MIALATMGLFDWLLVAWLAAVSLLGLALIALGAYAVRQRKHSYEQFRRVHKWDEIPWGKP